MTRNNLKKIYDEVKEDTFEIGSMRNKKQHKKTTALIGFLKVIDL